jgi:hypothetical protein
MYPHIKRGVCPVCFSCSSPLDVWSPSHVSFHEGGLQNIRIGSRSLLEILLALKVKSGAYHFHLEVVCAIFETGFFDIFVIIFRVHIINTRKTNSPLEIGDTAMLIACRALRESTLEKRNAVFWFQRNDPVKVIYRIKIEIQ